MSLQWSKAYRIQQTPSLNDGDKIILPSSALQELLTAGNNQLPSPLTFELRHPHTNAIIHSGVKEFADLTNHIQLPAWMAHAIDLNDEDHVLIKAKPLPKGTWVRLRPLSEDYLEITDYRAALESHLRGHYTTLTTGQTITCRYGAHSYGFLVVDLKPDQAVGVTDTDLEVDLDPINMMTDESIRSTPHSDIVEDVRIGTRHTSKITQGQYVYWKLDVGTVTTGVSISLKSQSGDVDLVVSTKPKPTLDNHDWSDLTSSQERTLVIEPVSLLDTKAVWVGIHAYTDAVVQWESTLAPIIEPTPAGNSGLKSVADKGEEEEEEEERRVANNEVQCKNCKAWLPQRTLMLHENFCLRNNVLCPFGCGQIFKKNSEEERTHWHCAQCDTIGASTDQPKHEAYFHTPKSCVCLQTSYPSYVQLAHHRRTECPERLITCRFCRNLVPQGIKSTDTRDRLLGLSAHESYCGSRTITCQKCKRQIPIKEIQVHAKIHEVARQQQAIPPLCSNQNCVRPRANNKLGLCQFCFGPFWATEDDPNNIKLVQRIARKLHSQLVTGCQHEWCRNKCCVTCTHMPQEATLAARTLIPMIQPLQRQLASGITPTLYLCVDEATTRKKFLAEMLAESTADKYDLGWCVKALETEQEDLEKARHWLDTNAPYKKSKNQLK